MNYWMNVVIEDNRTIKFDVADAVIGSSFISRNIGMTNIPPLRPTAPEMTPTNSERNTKRLESPATLLVAYAAFSASELSISSSRSLIDTSNCLFDFLANET